MTWEELYLTYSDRVYHFILLMVGNEETAEDLTHDTFLRIKDSLLRFRGEANYYTWIISIARNIVYDYWRRKRKIRFLSLSVSKPVIDFQTPDEIYEKGEEARELYVAIKRLKVNYQEVLIFRRIQELSIEETSVALGWSTSKVKTTTLRAMQALKSEMETMGKEGKDREKNLS